MEPEFATSQAPDRSSLAQVIRLGGWMCLFALGSTTDLLDHTDTSRA